MLLFHHCVLLLWNKKAAHSDETRDRKREVSNGPIASAHISLYQNPMVRRLPIRWVAVVLSAECGTLLPLVESHASCCDLWFAPSCQERPPPPSQEQLSPRKRQSEQARSSENNEVSDQNLKTSIFCSFLATFLAPLFLRN